MAAPQRTRRPRDERLGFRVDESTKSLIARAAELEGRKLTEFCVSTLTEAARRTVRNHDTLPLSERDRSVFFDVLMNPPPPNERLARAFAARKRRVAS